MTNCWAKYAKPVAATAAAFHHTHQKKGRQEKQSGKGVARGRRRWSRVSGTAWDVGKFNLIIIKLTRYKAPKDSKECQQRGKGRGVRKG